MKCSKQVEIEAMLSLKKQWIMKPTRYLNSGNNGEAHAWRPWILFGLAAIVISLVLLSY